MHIKISLLIAAGGLAALLLAACQTKPAPPPGGYESLKISEITKNEPLLAATLKELGIKKVMEKLLAESNNGTAFSCHDHAHIVGRVAYTVYKEKAFQQCSAECHSGCYHGATEAYFRDHGTANLTENLKVLCSYELNSFFSHQCIHGVGHGLMAWSDYELKDALGYCDLLPERKDSCWTGVFMENIVGSLGRSDGHFTKYTNGDPQYPCTIVDEKYKNSCYFLQTSRMMQMFGADFKKIAEACGKVPGAYKASCFSSMGRDIGGTYRRAPSGAIAACQFAPFGALRINCITGAAQDSFWDSTGQDDALEFCALLKDSGEKNSCYATVFQRATEILTPPTDFQAFCEKAEKEYRTGCLLLKK